MSRASIKVVMSGGTNETELLRCSQRDAVAIAWRLLAKRFGPHDRLGVYAQVRAVDENGFALVHLRQGDKKPRSKRGSTNQERRQVGA
jgi:hypothetical protein